MASDSPDRLDHEDADSARLRTGSLRAEIGQTRPFASARIEAYLNLQRTADRVHDELARLLKSHGISAPQYNVLRILRGADDDGCSCARIGERMVTRVPDVTRLVDRLVNMGLVSRGRAEHDRRVVRVVIKAKGLETLARLDDPVNALHEMQFAALSDDEVDLLTSLLEKARQRDDASS